MTRKNGSKFFDFLTGYENPAVAGSKHSVGRRFCAAKLSGRVTQKSKRFLDSLPIKMLRGIMNIFSYTPAKNYGIFFLTFGALSLVIQFTKAYFGILQGTSLTSLIISVCFAILSIPLLLVDVPVSVMLEKFKPTERIFFEFFCIKRLYYSGTEKAMPAYVSAIAGVLLAALGLVAPMWIPAVGMGALLFATVSFISPEFCFFSTLLFLPYFSYVPYSSHIMCAAVLLGAVSFVVKTFFGKRVVFVEQYDIVIGIFAAAVLISGIFIGGMDSFVGGAIMAVMTFGYFLAGNIVTNRRLADCAVNAVAVSSLPAVIISIVDFIRGCLGGRFFAILEEGVDSCFSDSGAAAAFFIVTAVFSIILAKESSGFASFLYSILASFNFIALILTAQTAAALALVFALLAYAALNTGKWILLLIPVMLAAPYFLYFMPEFILDKIPEYLYERGFFAVLISSASAFLDNILLGIGIGESSFASEMPAYGVTGRADSGNLFLELGLEAGIFALCAFALLLIIRLVHGAAYHKYVVKSHVSNLSPLASVTVFALLIYGSFNYIFSDASVMFLFFTVFGIAGASLRVARQEHDDRVLYFEDEKSSESSVVNIHIR